MGNMQFYIETEERVRVIIGRSKGSLPNHRDTFRLLRGLKRKEGYSNLGHVLRTADRVKKKDANFK